MKNEERKLFRSLCSFQSETFDEKLLAFATPSVLGQLFFNRMQGVAYGTLKKHGLLGRVNREFRNALKGAYEQNAEKNQSFFSCIQHVTDILFPYNYQYAMLKGAYLCRYYPEGYRTSNDIDLLVLPQNVTEIGNALREAGFRQGNIRNGEFVPATRKEIIESKMMRGETVPYIKEMRLPQMKYLEVDINFSLDYKNGDAQVIEVILDRACIKNVRGMRVKTLDNYDFFIHLCSHLYKEASTLPWVEMMRDMTLYKYCDIYMLLNKMAEEDVRRIYDRALTLGIDKQCAFAVLQMAQLFDIKSTYALGKAGLVLESDSVFLHRVVSPEDKRSLIYTEKSVWERFFADNRKELLKEEQVHGKIEYETE